MSDASPQPRVFDPALAYERTALAWSRVGLLTLGMAALIPRILWHLLGWWSLAFAVIALTLAASIVVASRRRHRRVRRDPSASTHDGLLPLATVVVCVILGAAGLVAFF